MYNQHESVLRGNVNYNFQLALNTSTLTATSDELVVTPNVDPQLALSLCEDKLSLGLLGAGGGSLKEEWHTSPKVTAAFLRLVSKATCCLAHALYAVKHFVHIVGGLSASCPSRIGPMTKGSSILFSIRDFHRSTTSLALELARDHLSLAIGTFSLHPTASQPLLSYPRKCI